MSRKVLLKAWQQEARKAVKSGGVPPFYADFEASYKATHQPATRRTKTVQQGARKGTHHRGRKAA